MDHAGEVVDAADVVDAAVDVFFVVGDPFDDDVLVRGSG